MASEEIVVWLSFLQGFGGQSLNRKGFAVSCNPSGEIHWSVVDHVDYGGLPAEPGHATQ
jgi:hypothetical protein